MNNNNMNQFHVINFNNTIIQNVENSKKENNIISNNLQSINLENIINTKQTRRINRKKKESKTNK